VRPGSQAATKIPEIDIVGRCSTGAKIMRIKLRSRGRCIAHAALLMGLLSSAMFLPSRAEAALGGSVTSVEADQQQMKAKRAVQANGKYSLHEITTPYGTVVREYVSPAGQVFGVAWRGPFLPNFSQLLGTYFGEFAKGVQEAKAANPKRSRNAPLAVEHTDFVMHSAGHTRAYVGRAYVPAMIPKGVDVQEIR
jgi:hypothetical protein